MIYGVISHKYHQIWIRNIYVLILLIDRIIAIIIAFFYVSISDNKRTTYRSTYIYMHYKNALYGHAVLTLLVIVVIIIQ